MTKPAIRHLGDALAAELVRPDRLNTQRQILEDQQLGALVSAIAVLEGEDPVRACAELQKDTVLTRLFRKVLAGGIVKPAPKKRGRKQDIEKIWREFCLVVLARRSSAPLLDAYRKAAITGEHLSTQTTDQETIERAAERYRQVYERAKKRLGWTDADVPQGVAALFAPPPVARSDKTPATG